MAKRKWYRNEKLWCVVGGFAGAIIGKKILTADCTRKAAVSGIAKGMKLKADANKTFQNMKDEASDICYDAKNEAGLNDEEENDEEE